MKFTKRAMVHSKERRESQKEFWDEDCFFVLKIRLENCNSKIVIVKSTDILETSVMFE